MPPVKEQTPHRKHTESLSEPLNGLSKHIEPSSRRNGFKDAIISAIKHEENGLMLNGDQAPCDMNAIDSVKSLPNLKIRSRNMDLQDKAPDQSERFYDKSKQQLHLKGEMKYISEWNRVIYVCTPL